MSLRQYSPPQSPPPPWQYCSVSPEFQDHCIFCKFKFGRDEVVYYNPKLSNSSKQHPAPTVRAFLPVNWDITAELGLHVEDHLLIVGHLLMILLSPRALLPKIISLFFTDIFHVHMFCPFAVTVLADLTNWDLLCRFLNAGHTGLSWGVTLCFRLKSFHCENENSTTGWAHHYFSQHIRPPGELLYQPGLFGL